MGILSEEVEVNLWSSNISYYEELGYQIPRRIDNRGRNAVSIGSKIKVKIEHLRKGSHQLIDVCCDNCGKQYQIEYRNYNNYLRDNKLYCYNCTMTLFFSGENHHNWNYDLTEEDRERHRQGKDYIIFLNSVLERDKYLCCCCGSHNNLHVHHLDGYNWCKEKRTDVTNGITLCKECHGNFHSIYGYGDNTKEQFEEWINRKINPEYYTSNNIIDREYIIHENGMVFDTKADLHKYLKCRKSRITDLYVNGVIDKTHKAYATKGYHVFYKDQYDLLSREELEYMTSNIKSPAVVLLNTKTVYNTTLDAEKDYNVLSKCILECCSGRNKSSGIDSNGIPLVWVYKKDYDKMSSYDIRRKLIEPFLVKNVIYLCTTTGVYCVGKEGCKKYIKQETGDICYSIRHNTNYGKLEDGTKLYWEKADIGSLSLDELEKILYGENC